MITVCERDRTQPAETENNDEFIRLPGLFRRFELEQVINFDDEFQYEPAGRTAEGTGLISIYRRPKQAGAL